MSGKDSLSCVDFLLTILDMADKGKDLEAVSRQNSLLRINKVQASDGLDRA